MKVLTGYTNINTLSTETFVTNNTYKMNMKIKSIMLSFTLQIEGRKPLGCT